MKVKEYANKNDIDCFSLYMWYSRLKTAHGSFGITYIDNTIDWIQYFKNYLDYINYEKYKLNINYFLHV